MEQDFFDLIVVLSLAVFCARGFLVGFIKEVSGVVALIGAFWASHTYYQPVFELITKYISNPHWRSIIAYLLIFLSVILIVGIITRIIQKLFTFAFITWIDKLVGGFFGLAKGVLIISIFMLFIQKFFAQSQFITQSRTIPYFTGMLTQIKSWIPPDILQNFGL